MTPSRFAGGPLLIRPPRYFADDRGFVLESYRQGPWSEVGLPPFVQDNHTRSRRGVVRGIHFSLSGGGQGKLVRCALGAIWDVAVDLRRSSPTFGRWQAWELSEDNRLQLWLPPGFGHGFGVVAESADVIYKLSSYYDPATELGVRWDDPELAVAWPIASPILSQRDLDNPSLRQAWERLPA